jgi:hypothetical protein
MESPLKFGDLRRGQSKPTLIKEFISGLKCSHKRINNILVPMRSMMKFALKAEIIDKNPM